MASAYAAYLAELEDFAREHLPAELDDISPGEPDGIQPEDLPSRFDVQCLPPDQPSKGKPKP
jgi:hypothetical protein